MRWARARYPPTDKTTMKGMNASVMPTEYSFATWLAAATLRSCHEDSACSWRRDTVVVMFMARMTSAPETASWVTTLACARASWAAVMRGPRGLVRNDATSRRIGVGAMDATVSSQFLDSMYAAARRAVRACDTNCRLSVLTSCSKRSMSLEKRDWISPECSPCIVAAVAWARRLTARARRDRCRRALKWPARSFPTNVHATDAARRATLMTMSWRRACSPVPETTRETERPKMSAKAIVDSDTTTAHAIAPTNSQVSAPASRNRRFMACPLSVPG